MTSTGMVIRGATSKQPSISSRRDLKKRTVKKLTLCEAVSNQRRCASSRVTQFDGSSLFRLVYSLTSTRCVGRAQRKKRKTSSCHQEGLALISTTGDASTRPAGRSGSRAWARKRVRQIG